MSARLKNLTAGESLPERQHTPTNVSLFLYNAAIWNPHRIHFDVNYSINVEHHPGVVIDGPLQGDWLVQLITDWLAGDGDLIAFEYSNRRASYLGETLTAAGMITAIDFEAGTVDLDIFIRNEESEIVTPGSATVRFSQ